jgi:hypothetical protein
MMVLDSWEARQSWVDREYRRGLSTHPRGPPVSVDFQCGGCVVAYHHCLGEAHQDVQEPVSEGGVQSQGPELGRTMVLNAQL